APHILPSATVTASASTDFSFSRLNSPPHAIAVYASRRSSPSAPQHSLPSARYGLLGPDFHRLDRASFAWRTTVTGIRSHRNSYGVRSHAGVGVRAAINSGESGLPAAIRAASGFPVIGTRAVKMFAKRRIQS